MGTMQNIDNKIAELVRTFEIIVKFESRIVIDGEEDNEKRASKRDSLVKDIEIGVTSFGGLNHLLRVRAAELAEKWRNEPATEKQIEYLKVLGVTVEGSLTKGDASDKIELAQIAKEKAETAAFLQQQRLARELSWGAAPQLGADNKDRTGMEPMIGGKGSAK